MSAVALEAWFVLRQVKRSDRNLVSMSKPFLLVLGTSSQSAVRFVTFLFCLSTVALLAQGGSTVTDLEEKETCQRLFIYIYIWILLPCQIMTMFFVFFKSCFLLPCTYILPVV